MEMRIICVEETGESRACLFAFVLHFILMLIGIIQHISDY